MSLSAILFSIVEMIGMVAFALSGAMTGLKYKLDPFGVITLAVTTSLGGGVIRDLLIGRTPPAMFQDYRYLLTAVITALAVFLVAYCSKGRYHSQEARIEALNNIFDALGLGAFTTIGVQVGIGAGYADNGFLLVFLGLLTGIGGGVMRDLFVQRMPVVLHKHIYALAVLAGSSVYVILYRLSVSQLINTPVTIALIFTIRMLATRFRWNLPHAD